MIRIVIIILLALFGIFVHPFDPGAIDFIYRFIVFSLLTYLVYYGKIRKSENPVEPTLSPVIEKKEKRFTKPDTKWKIEELLSSDKKISKYIKDQFDVIASLLIPDNGWIFIKHPNGYLKTFYYKSYKNEVIELYKERYEISGLMQILDNYNKILIENKLDESDKLINYYEETDYKAASFIGIPVDLDEHERLFFVFDSSEKDNFNQEDANLIEKLVSGINTLVLNRVKAYSLLFSLKESESLLEFAKELNGSKTISLAIENLATRISQIFEATRLTISTINRDKNVATVKKVIGQENDFAEHKEFPLDEGLTGWIISKNKPYLIEDLEKGEYFIPRYTKSEKTNFGLRSFLGVPIEIDEKVFGAVTLEHASPYKYNQEEKTRLQQYVNIFNTTFLRNINQ